ncbi:5-hydroxyisourate hydrolase like protein [Verticillium longisporum]|uniref:5-hydroxyisourate hydrolase n=3 Tax=Verticillium TaxID=1036719 RepID=A0A2J8CUS9_VERDA|nr:5-hydroxyisourate hydrolase like protein [Verticillium longisporum]KAH6709790.1 transthyretin [Verticillium dahliae]KAG7125949.1 5-hydroxyisourate hydrolase like protein [Verticillium longisporum]PNH29587.1 hypothetical protein BJF96_g7031 [Verticillium dahliae]PNH40763.1 hypothetical protein VD0004_g6269 [Verticillium dahliae]
MATKDRITCHVLDTTAGRPARALRVQLTHTPPSAPDAGAPTAAATTPRTFESITDDDGRVKTWLPYSAATASGDVPVYTLDDVLGELAAEPTSRWTLRFDTGAYFEGQGTETFFPEVHVVFTVQQGQGYHVPLLLSPYSYSTYRGS